MPEPIVVSAEVVVPAEALEVRAVRASGPGGQNVNKVASKVELRVDLARVRGLDASVLQRLRSLAGRRLDTSGRLLVTSQRTRDQHRNLEDARDKVRTWLERALVPDKARVPTRPRAGSREQRLSDKHRRAERKAGRRRTVSDD